MIPWQQVGLFNRFQVSANEFTPVLTSSVRAEVVIHSSLVLPGLGLTTRIALPSDRGWALPGVGRLCICCSLPLCSRKGCSGRYSAVVFCSALTQQARPTDRKRPALPGQTQVRNQMWLGTPHLGRPATTIGPFLSWVPALVSPSMYPCSSACRLRVLLVLSESAVLPNVPSSVPSPRLRAVYSSCNRLPPSIPGLSMLARSTPFRPPESVAAIGGLPPALTGIIVASPDRLPPFRHRSVSASCGPVNARRCQLPTFLPGPPA